MKALVVFECPFEITEINFKNVKVSTMFTCEDDQPHEIQWRGHCEDFIYHDGSHDMSPGFRTKDPTPRHHSEVYVFLSEPGCEKTAVVSADPNEFLRLNGIRVDGETHILGKNGEEVDALSMRPKVLLLVDSKNKNTKTYGL